MTDRPTNTGTGGGIFLMVFLLTGACIGIYLGQPSLGVLGGLAAGIIAATLHWLMRPKG